MLKQGVSFNHDVGYNISVHTRLKAPHLRRYGYGYMYVCIGVDMISHLPKIFYIQTP